MSTVYQNSDLSPVWVLCSLSPTKKLWMNTILFQLPLGSNIIPSQLLICDGRGWMSCRSGGTSCCLTRRISSVGWYSWGGKKDTRELRFWIESDDWGVCWCFRYLYIADIFWNIIQSSLGSLCDACVLLNLDTFTNLERDFIFWSSCSSYFLFTRLITFRQYHMDDFSLMP